MTYKLINTKPGFCNYRGYEVIKIEQPRFHDITSKTIAYQCIDLDVIAFSPRQLKQRMDRRISREQATG